MVRGRRSPDDPLPEGIRQDTRKHTRHPLRPPKELVVGYLADPTDAAWESYVVEYQRVLAERFRADRAPYDALARLALKNDVWLGCNCPTARNPDPRHCHTMLALEFMKEHYPELDVRI